MRQADIDRFDHQARELATCLFAAGKLDIEDLLAMLGLVSDWALIESEFSDLERSRPNRIAGGAA